MGRIVKTGCEFAVDAIRWVVEELNYDKKGSVAVVSFGLDDNIVAGLRHAMMAGRLSGFNLREHDGWYSSLEQLSVDAANCSDLFCLFMKGEQACDHRCRHEVIEKLRSCGYRGIVEVFSKVSGTSGASSEVSRWRKAFEEYPPDAEGIEALVVIEQDVPDYREESLDSDDAVLIYSRIGSEDDPGRTVAHLWLSGCAEVLCPARGSLCNVCPISKEAVRIGGWVGYTEDSGLW